MQTVQPLSHPEEAMARASETAKTHDYPDLPPEFVPLPEGL